MRVVEKRMMIISIVWVQSLKSIPLELVAQVFVEYILILRTNFHNNSCSILYSHYTDRAVCSMGMIRILL